MRTRTSPGPGPASWTSSTVTGDDDPRKTAARMMAPRKCGQTVGSTLGGAGYRVDEGGGRREALDAHGGGCLVGRHPLASRDHLDRAGEIGCRRLGDVLERQGFEEPRHRQAGAVL